MQKESTEKQVSKGQDSSSQKKELILGFGVMGLCAGALTGYSNLDPVRAILGGLLGLQLGILVGMFPYMAWRVAMMVTGITVLGLMLGARLAGMVGAILGSALGFLPPFVAYHFKPPAEAAKAQARGGSEIKKGTLHGGKSDHTAHK